MKYEVGDLVQHRASGERAVILKHLGQDKLEIEMYEVALSYNSCLTVYEVEIDYVEASDK